jgi:hypothetical protein
LRARDRGPAGLKACQAARGVAAGKRVGSQGEVLHFTHCYLTINILY